MPFTDDDIIRLKSLCRSNPLEFERNSIGYWTVRDGDTHLKVFDDITDHEALLLRYAVNDLPALLARLEAAERVAECDQLCDKHTNLQKVWLKSAGREGR